MDSVLTAVSGTPPHQQSILPGEPAGARSNPGTNRPGGVAVLTRRLLPVTSLPHQASRLTQRTR